MYEVLVQYKVGTDKAGGTVREDGGSHGPPFDPV